MLIFKLTEKLLCKTCNVSSLGGPFKNIIRQRHADKKQVVVVGGGVGGEEVSDSCVAEECLSHLQTVTHT